MSALLDKKASIIVVASSSEGAALVQLLQDASTAWTCRLMPSTELRQRSADLEAAAAIIVVTDAASDEACRDTLPPKVPVIACGDTAPRLFRPLSWLQRPSSAVLRSLLHEVLEPVSTPIPPPAAVPHWTTPPPTSSGGGKWRRKTDTIIGGSAAIRGVLATLDRIAPSPAPVIITGESGTGKELVARALHYSSPRAPAPFIALNCAAIPESLFEAELFGYQRGAFTGAVANRTGAFEGADKGTLFLDEIGEMPITLQPKLLRVLERGEVTPLGSNEVRKVAVRVVTATNRQLEDEVRRGTFRQDLLYRLRVCQVHLPPLRQRLEDIAPVVAHQLAIIAARERRNTPMRLNAAALEKILAHRWPGNVRELVNTLESAVLLASGDVIAAEHLNFGAVGATAAPEQDAALLSYREAKARFEAEYYTRVLRAAHGNISLASKLAQKTRKEVYDALRRAGLEAKAYRDDELQDG